MTLVKDVISYAIHLCDMLTTSVSDVLTICKCTLHVKCNYFITDRVFRYVLVSARIELTFLGLRGSTAGGSGPDRSLEYSTSYDVMLSIEGHGALSVSVLVSQSVSGGISGAVGITAGGRLRASCQLMSNYCMLLICTYYG